MTTNSALNVASMHTSNAHSGDFQSPYLFFVLAAMKIDKKYDRDITKFIQPWRSRYRRRSRLLQGYVYHHEMKNDDEDVDAQFDGGDDKR